MTMIDDDELKILHNFILWQKSLLDYNALYQAYILNSSFTEEQFEQYANEFIIPQTYLVANDIPINKLSIEEIVMIELTDNDFVDFINFTVHHKL